MILRKQFLEHVGQTSPSPMMVEVARAEGSFFYTPEGKRYFDLVRTGKAASTLTPANDSGHYRTKGWSEDVRYFPIPQDNIDAAKGTLKQNGSY